MSAKKTKSFWRRHTRLWKWLGGIFGGLVVTLVAIFIWFQVSTWPGAMVIRYVFNQGSAKTAQALEKHAPNGITVMSDQKYKSGDTDASLDVYIPESALRSNEKLPVVIWTHGGAWLSGDKTDAASYFKLLAKEGYTVVAPNYSLAPEHTYPTPIHQLNAMYSYVQENAARFHADTSQIVLAGDSAGSQLSAQMAALITNPTYAKQVGIEPNLKPDQLKGVVLTCGIYKMEELAHPEPSLGWLIGWGDRETVWAYSGTRDFDGPVVRQMSPYYHVTKDFPAAFVTGGNADPLTNAQSKPLARKLESLNVQISTLFYPKSYKPPLPHEYQFNLDEEAGQQAFSQIVEFLRNHTK